MKIGQAGIDLIKKFEGCKLTAYLCPAGVWTIGYGHTGQDVKPGLTITQAKAEQLLKNDLEKFEQHVMLFNRKYCWSQNEFDALVSFAYNVGSINQLTKNMQRTKKQIADAMLQYNKGGGKVLPGLTKRRQEERSLFLKPDKKQEVENEMVQNGKVIVDGKEVPVRLILKDGTNYISVRDIGKAIGYDVSAKGNVPVLSKR